MFFKSKEAKRVKHKLVKQFIQGKTLDIGYGSFPSPDAEDFYGVDIQDREPPKGYKEVRSADLNTQPIPYENNFFDSVIAADVIEHLMNPLKVFLEVNRVLKKGGKFVFVVPNPHFYKEIITNIFAGHYFKTGIMPLQEAHINLPTRHTVRTMLWWSGFELKKEKGSGFPVPKIKYVLKMEKSPGLSYEIIYVAEKVSDEPKFSVISKQTDGEWKML